MPDSDLRQRLLDQWKTRREDALRVLEERAKIYAEGQIPYDKDVAHEAVRQFLDNLGDGGRFKRKLNEAMKKDLH